MADECKECDWDPIDRHARGCPSWHASVTGSWVPVPNSVRGLNDDDTLLLCHYQDAKDGLMRLAQRCEAQGREKLAGELREMAVKLEGLVGEVMK